MSETWIDGICNLCGSIVEEGASDQADSDYMNRCTNESCIEHKWHYCGDIEFPNYYKHR